MARGSSALATTSRQAGRAEWLPVRSPTSAAPTSAVQAGGQLPGGAPAPGADGLAQAGTVLAVIARPGPESADLGALLYAHSQAGADLAVLSLTRGEASPVNSTRSRLEAVRPWELQLASWLLGVSSVAVADYPDGGLRDCPLPDLTARVQRAIAEHAPDLILVVDPATGDCDDARVAQAVSLAAQPAGVPVAARTSHGARGGWRVELGDQADAARAVQRSAVRAHASQSEAVPGMLFNSDHLGNHEQLRWLRPAAATPQVLVPRAAVEPCDGEVAPAVLDYSELRTPIPAASVS